MTSEEKNAAAINPNALDITIEDGGDDLVLSNGTLQVTMLAAGAERFRAAREHYRSTGARDAAFLAGVLFGASLVPPPKKVSANG